MWKQHLPNYIHACICVSTKLLLLFEWVNNCVVVVATQTLIMLAVKFGQIDVVKVYLNKCGHHLLMQHNIDGQNLLHFAVENFHMMVSTAAVAATVSQSLNLIINLRQCLPHPCDVTHTCVPMTDKLSYKYFTKLISPSPLSQMSRWPGLSVRSHVHTHIFISLIMTSRTRTCTACSW